MKISPIIILTALLATVAAAFDKWEGWGKRDYPCINVFQGIPDDSTVTPGQTIHIRFNRVPTTHCPSLPRSYHRPGNGYSIWLYNNMVRIPNGVKWDERIKLLGGIKNSADEVAVKIPENLPKVNNSDVWYLRLDTTLVNAPMMPTLYNAAGPFKITST